jgi:hypothetical protein
MSTLSRAGAVCNTQHGYVYLESVERYTAVLSATNGYTNLWYKRFHVQKNE